MFVYPFQSNTFLFPIEESVSQDPDCDKRGLQLVVAHSHNAAVLEQQSSATAAPFF